MNISHFEWSSLGSSGKGMLTLLLNSVWHRLGCILTCILTSFLGHFLADHLSCILTYVRPCCRTLTVTTKHVTHVLALVRICVLMHGIGAWRLLHMFVTHMSADTLAISGRDFEALSRGSDVYCICWNMLWHFFLTASWQLLLRAYVHDDVSLDVGLDN